MLNVASSLDALGCDNTLCGELMSRMREPWRYYHTIEHIEELLTHLEPYSEEPNFRERIAAIWFHDIVYAPGNSRNEELSELLMRDRLRGYPINVELVSRMILDTKTHETYVDPWFCDADMAILGSSPERYQRYTHQIRQEFGMYSDAQFNSGRIAFLKKTIEHPIFITEIYRARYEDQARRNIFNEITLLE